MCDLATEVVSHNKDTKKIFNHSQSRAKIFRAIADNRLLFPRFVVYL